jgi:Glycosyl transferases group 1
LELAAAWRSQSNFERLHMASILPLPSKTALAWGWSHLDTNGKTKARWAFTDCGIYFINSAKVRMSGFAPTATVCLIRDSNGNEILHQKIQLAFDIEFESPCGFINISSSKIETVIEGDPRPLALYVQKIMIDECEFDLGTSLTHQSISENAMETYAGLESAARASRGEDCISLTNIRGPHSQTMESYITKSIKEYDIVVTHNSVFRPAAFALKAAKAAGIPSILFPHAHLDDDFYHFPDVHQAALDADLVLASPKAACDFYTSYGSKQVKYHSPGIDIGEEFTNADESEFRKLFRLTTPFFLILGRKAGAKGYADVISEIDKIALSRNVHLVMIGPDEDRAPIESMNVTYLGQQPRSVVRGALKSAIALVNMSSSESFGMVLLESWLAGRPVIANVNCSAFRDLAIHEQNSLLTSKESLGASLNRLASDDLLCTRLGRAGKESIRNYDWSAVCKSFLTECNVLLK